ncbi:MAG: hypothetical protein ACI9JN_001694 [Bacteroidia bacterium]|jgi:hypothetical protein
MGRNRKTLILWIFGTVLVGLLSRLDMLSSVIPLGVGDLLYATLIYFLMALLFPNFKSLSLLLLSFGFCVVIEFGQLLNWDFLITLRAHWFGKLVLGNDFKWLDIMWYLCGAGFGVLLDRRFIIRELLNH